MDREERGRKRERRGARAREKKKKSNLSVPNFFLLNFPSDIDECTMGIDGCDPRGRCVNTAGSFQCMCDSLTGFQLGSDQRTCVGTFYCKTCTS